MTEDQKRAAIAALMERAKAADRRGLFATGKSWRDQAYTLSMRRAQDVVLARNLDDLDPSDARTVA